MNFLEFFGAFFIILLSISLSAFLFFKFKKIFTAIILIIVAMFCVYKIYESNKLKNKKLECEKSVENKPKEYWEELGINKFKNVRPGCKLIRGKCECKLYHYRKEN